MAPAGQDPLLSGTRRPPGRVCMAAPCSGIIFRHVPKAERRGRPRPPRTTVSRDARSLWLVLTGCQGLSQHLCHAWAAGPVLGDTTPTPRRLQRTRLWRRPWMRGQAGLSGLCLLCWPQRPAWMVGQWVAHARGCWASLAGNTVLRGARCPLLWSRCLRDALGACRDFVMEGRGRAGQCAGHARLSPEHSVLPAGWAEVPVTRMRNPGPGGSGSV